VGIECGACFSDLPTACSKDRFRDLAAVAAAGLAEEDLGREEDLDPAEVLDLEEDWEVAEGIGRGTARG
jgi:hypothetical protein